MNQQQPSQPILIPTPSDPVRIPRLSLSSGSHDSASTISPSLSSSPSPSTSSVSSSDSASTVDSCCETCCPSAPKLPVKALPDDLPSTSTRPLTSPKPLPIALPSTSFQPLIIVGAGPHSLALAARLSESRPAALYTDLEHARLSWLRREKNEKDRMKRKTVKGHWTARKLIQPEEKEVVDKRAFRILDSSKAGFMGRWDAFFAKLRLEHLRSPMLFHPQPSDADALVAYAMRTGREKELKAIDGVVGAERSKYQRKKKPSRTGRAHTINERERQDYYRPSTSLFRSFVEEELVNRYDLSSLVTHSTVTSVSYGPLHIQGEEMMDGFRVESTNADGSKEVLGAKAVVFAVGPSSKPNVPQVVKDALDSAGETAKASLEEDPSAAWRRGDVLGEAWCHSAAFALDGFTFLSKRVRAKIDERKKVTVVVIGGGLTSAQITDLAVKRGATRVVLLCRGQVKVKHFDFDLEWVSKYQALEKMAFWQEECRYARHDIITQARNGGSVNPQYLHILKAHVKASRVELKTFTRLTGAHYDPETRLWELAVETMLPEGKMSADGVRATPREPVRERIEQVDYLVCSTGSKLDFSQMDCVKPLLESHPIELVNGLPVLTRDLQWSEELPAFVMGAYAMLELGPDALNLSGTRHGAERVAYRLGALGLLDEGEQDAGEDRAGTRQDQKESRSGGENNYYAMLQEEEA